MSNANGALGTCRGSIPDSRRREPVTTMTKPMTATGLPWTPTVAHDANWLDGASAASVHASDFTISG